MDLSRLRIGYVPCSPDLLQPGDRRRFCYFARERGLRFEIANPTETYDLVILSERADLTQWSELPPHRGKLIFDLIDAYLAIPESDIKNSLRGIAKFATRQWKRPKLSFHGMVEQMCRRADAVVCSTAEQKRLISALNSNVHVILDIHSEVTRHLKGDYSAKAPFKLVWEGQAGNLDAFVPLMPMLESLSTTHPFTLHLITDLEYFQYLGSLWRRSTKKLIASEWPRTYLYEWNDLMASAVITNSDLAIIPVRMDHPLTVGKAPNKLLLLWRMGMPVITSATPAYQELMTEAGLRMTCSSEQEWLRVLTSYLSDQELRYKAGHSGREIAEKIYGEKQMLSRWQDVIKSVFNTKESNSSHA